MYICTLQLNSPLWDQIVIIQFDVPISITSRPSLFFVGCRRMSGSCSSPILGEISSAKLRPPSELTATWQGAPSGWTNKYVEIQMLLSDKSNRSIWGFHKWGYPNSWSFYKGKSIYRWMIWGYPHLWKPRYRPYPPFEVGVWKDSFHCLLGPIWRHLPRPAGHKWPTRCSSHRHQCRLEAEKSPDSDRYGIGVVSKRKKPNIPWFEIMFPAKTHFFGW